MKKQRSSIPDRPTARSSRRVRRFNLPELLEARTLLSTYWVTSAADDGAGSLRQAILNANVDTTPDIIAFNISGSGVQTITPLSPLPAVTNSVFIDATTQSGYALNSPMIDLSGVSAGAGANGLELQAAGSGIKGLAINNFTGAAVLLDGAGGDTIANNFLGTDPTGTLAQPNGGGVLVNSSHNLISNNLISGNTVDGVSISGTSITPVDGTVIAGNLIGADVTGELSVGNASGAYNAAGVYVSYAINTVIGGTTAADRNVISGNAHDGVAFANISGLGNIVEGNYIGTDVTGLNPLSNFANGVDLGTIDTLAVSNVTVTDNLISANFASGVYLSAASNNFVAGNLIGTDINGQDPQQDNLGDALMGNRGSGVFLDFGAASNTIGGTAAVARNLISANWSNGISINTHAMTPLNLIEGNWIGTDGTGAAASPNQGDGMYVSGGGAIIGAPGAGNVISGNFGEGLQLTNGAIVQGNFIGTDPTGTATVPNLDNGILISGSNNQIGGSVPGAGNVIAFNRTSGVVVNVGSGNAIRENSIFSNVQLGIDLGGDGVTQNHTPPASSGPNLNQNFPVLGAVTVSNGSATVQGTLNASPSATYYIDVFSNTSGTASGGYGQGLTFVGTATVNTDTAGSASFTVTLPGVPTGQMVFSATATDAVGNTSEFGADVMAAFVAGPASTSLTLGSSLNPSVAGQSVTFTATLAGWSLAPTGGVSFSDGSTALGSGTLSNGIASFSTSALTVGTHLITANYAGDVNNSGSSNSLSQQVNPDATTTLITSSANPSVFGQAVTFTATVGSGALVPTGTVTFMDGSRTLAIVSIDATGQASCTTAALPADVNGVLHTITATYSGDATHNPSSGAVSQEVDRATTNTVVVSNLNPSTYGQTVTFTATVSAAVLGTTPTGTVTFMDGFTVLGSGNVSNGVATFSTSALSVGSHGISAVYSGDSNFTAGTSASLSQIVNVPPSTVSGHVFSDVTGNGLSSDDTAMSGITVQLYQDENGNGKLDASDTLVATAVTDSSGGYAFTSLPVGVYFVKELTPGKYVETDPAKTSYYIFTSADGGSVTNDDFDNYLECHGCKADISGVKFIINGSQAVTNLRGHTHQGDVVQVQFTVISGNTDLLSLVSYTAPGATFVASQASQQQIYQDDSGTFGPGTYTLSVVIPRSFYQIDFVCGYAIDRFGLAGSNIFYSAQDRLISADNGGTNPPPAA